MARPVPPVAPATKARSSENADEEDVRSGESIGTTSPSEGVRSSAQHPQIEKGSYTQIGRDADAALSCRPSLSEYLQPLEQCTAAFLSC